MKVCNGVALLFSIDRKKKSIIHVEFQTLISKMCRRGGGGRRRKRKNKKKRKKNTCIPRFVRAHCA